MTLTRNDTRMRPTSVNVSSVLGYNYSYFEHTERVSYAQSLYDPTLDRSSNYDQVGALGFARSGAEARATFGINGQQWGQMDGPYSHQYQYDQFGNMTYRHGWGGEVQGGAPYGGDTTFNYTYSTNKNQRDGFTYDPAGNLTSDGPQTYSYDATGQQASASATNYFLQQGYDGDGLRAFKNENGTTTYYLRSTVLGGAVVAEVDGSGNQSRGYVYAGGELMSVQQGGQVSWVHQDSVTKSQRVTDVYGNVINSVELDPWGANTNRSSASAFQPQNFTTYIRDGNGEQDAMARRYSAVGRFSQPDPYSGSYSFSDPQSLNRYAYVGNDPVNRNDPSGLLWDFPEAYWGFSHFASGFWGGGFDMNRHTSLHGASGRETIELAEHEFDYRIDNESRPFRFHSAFVMFPWFESFQQNPLPPPRPQPHPTPGPVVPKRKPPCVPNGTADVGAEMITPVLIGPKGGVQLDSRGVYPYFGIAGGTPGKGVSVTGTANKQMATPGITLGFSAALVVGFSYSSAPITQGSVLSALRHGSWQFGGGTPGVSGNMNVVLNSPQWLRRIWPCQ